jgi:hypothetical protein
MLGRVWWLDFSQQQFPEPRRHHSSSEGQAGVSQHRRGAEHFIIVLMRKTAMIVSCIIFAAVSSK